MYVPPLNPASVVKTRPIPAFSKDWMIPGMLEEETEIPIPPNLYLYPALAEEEGAQVTQEGKPPLKFDPLSSKTTMAEATFK